MLRLGYLTQAQHRILVRYTAPHWSRIHRVFRRVSGSLCPYSSLATMLPTCCCPHPHPDDGSPLIFYHVYTITISISPPPLKISSSSPMVPFLILWHTHHTLESKFCIYEKPYNICLFQSGLVHLAQLFPVSSTFLYREGHGQQRNKQPTEWERIPASYT